MQKEGEHEIRGLGILALSVLLFAVGMWRMKGTELVSSWVGERELPVYCVDTTKSQVALTFDADWGNQDTQKILEVLKKNQVHATFFVTGGWVDKYPEDVKKIFADGHDLGNHSQNHKNMRQLSGEACRQELECVEEKVKKLTGYEMFLFRPPYGAYNNQLMLTAKSCGYEVIQWDVDSLDWKDYGKEAILKQVLEHPHLGNGSIILCHNGTQYTAAVLEQLISSLKQKGYELVPVSELIYQNDFL